MLNRPKDLEPAPTGGPSFVAATVAGAAVVGGGVAGAAVGAGSVAAGVVVEPENHILFINFFNLVGIDQIKLETLKSL